MTDHSPDEPNQGTSNAEPERAAPEAESGELVAADEADDGSHNEMGITSPAKVMRIGSMVKQLLEEVREAPLDDKSRNRLAEVYERSVTELGDALSPELQHELNSLALPFDDGETPSDAELRVAKAQLVGWLEGLFHGIQATLFAQQMAAKQQFEQIRQLPQGVPAQPQQPTQQQPGTYL